MSVSYSIEAFSKEKTILKLIVNDGRSVTVNFKNNEIIGIGHRALKTVPLFCTSVEIQNPDINAVANLLNYCKRMQKDIKSIEPYLSCLDLIPYYVQDMLLPELKKGVVKYFRDNNLKFTFEDVAFYRAEGERTQFGLKDDDFKGVFKSYKNKPAYYPIIKKLQTLYINELKYCIKASTFPMSVPQFIHFLIAGSHESGELENIDWDAIDMTKGFYQNVILYQDYRDRCVNEKIAESEGKIADLDGKTFIINNEELVLKVPMTVRELKDEGNQMHSCVGYYWNQNIIAGDTLIYFLRKKHNIKKSYITCRFNISNVGTIYLGMADCADRATVEHRLANNKHFSGDFSEIDKAINALLG